MEKTYSMSSEELARMKRQADEVNARFKKKDGTFKGDMGKDAFLKLLVTELRHQDPTQPMADREFISQMAQFSSLEQMTNINASLQSMHRSSRAGEAYAMLGKRVEALDPATGKPVDGIVSKIFHKDNDIRLIVNGRELGMADVHAVLPPEERKKPVENAPAGKAEAPWAEKHRSEMKPQGLNAFLGADYAGLSPAIRIGMGKKESDSAGDPKGILINNDINREEAARSYMEHEKKSAPRVPGN